MEHLHVDDAEPQLMEIHRILKSGGQDLCATPSGVTKPHDISVFFDEVASVFHMQEYDYGSLRDLFLRVGFTSVRFPLVVRGWTPHAENPVVIDARLGRPAGAFIRQDGCTLRPVQDCARSYGGGVTFCRLDALNDTAFAQNPVGRMVSHL
jgi:hypothetical protein